MTKKHPRCQGGWKRFAYNPRDLDQQEEKSRNNFDRKGKCGETPIHFAIKSCGDETNLVELLLMANSRLDIRNEDGETLFSIAVKQNKRHIVNLLLENQEPNLTEIDKDGDTLLHSIIKYKMRDLVEKFLSESALNKVIIISPFAFGVLGDFELKLLHQHLLLL